MRRPCGGRAHLHGPVDPLWGCERTIREGLQGVEGVDDVTPAAATNTVALRLDPARRDDEDVRSRLAELGFPVVDEPDGDDDGRNGWARYLLLVVAVAAIALAGYAGYLLAGFG